MIITDNFFSTICDSVYAHHPLFIRNIRPKYHHLCGCPASMPDHDGIFSCYTNSKTHNEANC